MEKQKIELGKRVLVIAGNKKGEHGTIKFFGPVDNKLGVWYGVELDNPVGDSDGTYEEKSYFLCKAQHGLLLREAQIKVDENSKAPKEKEKSGMKRESQSKAIEKKEHKKKVEAKKVGKTTGQAVKGDTKRLKKPEKKEDKVVDDSSSSVYEATDEESSPERTEIKKEETPAPTVFEIKPIPSPPQTVPEPQPAELVPVVEEPVITSPLPKEENKGKVNEELQQQKLHEIMLENKKLKNEISAKVEILKDMRKDLDNLTKQNTEEKLAWLNKESEYTLKIQTLESKRFENKDLMNAEEMAVTIKKMQSEKEQLEKKLIEMQVDLETAQLEMEALKDQHELELKKIEEEKAIKSKEFAAGSAESIDLLKEKVVKMKMALEKMTSLYEGEKVINAQKTKENEEIKKKQEDIKEKFKDIDLLMETVDIRDKAIEELKLKLDEAHSYEKIVEKLTNESLGKDEEIEKLQKNIENLNEQIRLDEEIAEIMEADKKELNERIINGDFELKTQKRKQEELELKFKEHELTIKRYQEKMKIYREEIGLLEGQIKNSGQEDKLKKIEELVARQTRLAALLREARKFELDAITTEHNMLAVNLKLGFCLSFIPTKLIEYANVAGYDIVALIYSSRGKCDSALKVLKDKYLIDDEGSEINPAFVQYICDLLVKLTNVAVALDKILTYLSGCSCEEYDKIVKDQTKWRDILAVCSFINDIIQLIKKEELSPQVSLDTFTISAKAIVDFVAGLEQAAKVSGKRIGSEQSDKFIASTCLLRIDIPVSAYFYLYSKSTEGAFMQVEKSGKIHRNIKKCMDSLRKLKLTEDGSNYLRHWQMMEGSFEQKFEYSECLWMQGGEDYKTKEWGSWLEAVDALILGIYGNANFKELEKEEIGEKLEDIASYGPWGIQSKDINKELSEAAEMKKVILQLQDDIKAEKLKYLMLENQMKEVKLLKESFEKRLGEQLQKIERVGQLEIDKKRLVEKETFYRDSLENMGQDCTQKGQKIKELTDKLAAMETELNEAKAANKTRKLSAAQGDMKRGSVRLGSVGEIGKGSYTFDGGNYYLHIINRLIEEKEDMKKKSLIERMNTPNYENSEMDKLMKRLKGQSGGDYVQIEEEMDKLTKMSKSLAESMVKTPAINIKENDNQHNVQLLLEQKQQASNYCLKAKKTHMKILKELYPTDEENKIFESIPQKIKPLIEDVTKYIKIGKLELLGEGGAGYRTSVGLSSQAIVELDKRIKDWVSQQTDN